MSPLTVLFERKVETIGCTEIHCRTTVLTPQIYRSIDFKEVNIKNYGNQLL
jgi:hypothetical protein